MTASSVFVKAETVLVAVLVSSYVLVFATRRLRRRRPDFAVGLPLLVGFVLRLIAIAGISATGLGATLRGGDEDVFLSNARHLADSAWGHGFIPHGPFPLHTVVFAIQMKLADFSEGAMRVTQVGIATLGILLILAAVHDLAGRRAAWVAGWVLAFEPASVFFSSALHKEPLMVLASGLVVFGATKVWRHLGLYGILLMGLGGLFAVWTRPYAGWFLVSASVLVILHAALRRMDRPLKAMPLIYGVILAGFLAAPAVIQVTSEVSLTRLQTSQDANVAGAGQGTGGANTSNLALEKVDFSNRGAVIANLPRRVRDVVLRPYPWQLQNASQRLGAAGTLVAFAGLLALLRYAWRNRGHVLERTAPLLYPLVFLLIAYSLSAGNAGTGFRYRMHLVTLGLAVMVILREHALGAAAAARQPAVRDSRPVRRAEAEPRPEPLPPLGTA